MTRLEELYSKRDVFLDYEVAVPDKLVNEIAEAESVLLENLNDYMSDKVPTTIPESELRGNIIVALEYNDFNLSAIYSSCAADCIALSDMTKLPIEIALEEEDDEEIKSISKSASIPFIVKFDDGKIIKGPEAILTMIEALKYMGLERASLFDKKTFKGFKLVDRRRRPDRISKDGKKFKWQKKVDDWYIYSQISNGTKVECLNEIAKMLGITISIEWL